MLEVRAEKDVLLEAIKAKAAAKREALDTRKAPALRTARSGARGDDARSGAGGTACAHCCAGCGTGALRGSGARRGYTASAQAMDEF